MKKQLFLLGLLASTTAYGDYTVDYRISRSLVDISQEEIGTAALPPMFIQSSITENREFSTDQEIAAGDLDVYFGRVRTAGKPLGEAGFLSQLSNIQISANITEEEFEIQRDLYADGEFVDSFSAENDTEIASLGTDIEFITPGFPVVLGLGVTAGFGEAEFYDSVSEQDIEVSALRAKLGFYYSNNGRVTISYEDQETEYDGNDFDPDRDSEQTTVSLNWKHVFQLTDSQFLSVFGDYASTSRSFDRNNDEFDIKTLEAGVTYYPITNLGLGVSWLDEDNEGRSIESVRGYQVSVEYFFNNYIGFELNYQSGSGSDSETDLVYSSPSTGPLYGPTDYDLDRDQVTAVVNVRF